MNTAQKLILGSAVVGGVYYFFLRNPKQEELQVGGSSVYPDGSFSAGGSDTPVFNFGNLFGDSNKSSGGSYNTDSNVSSKKEATIIPDASTSATGLVVKNALGTYSPLDSRGNVLPQSVSKGVAQNQFGGFSPVVNGKMLPQSVPAPIISKKDSAPVSTSTGIKTKVGTGTINLLKRLVGR